MLRRLRAAVAEPAQEALLESTDGLPIPLLRSRRAGLRAAWPIMRSWAPYRRQGWHMFIGRAIETSPDSAMSCPNRE